jgi:glycosyltransferase involved in cell wall biosynthesis
MHICWISDSPETPSGFGNVTRFVCGGLARRGHRVDIIGWQTDEQHAWEGCTVHSSRGAQGSEALFPLLVRRRPDMVIALGDVWWMPYFNAPHIRRQMEMTGAPWALYFPIDGETADGLLPPGWIDLLKAVDVPIAMSRYGQEVAGRCGVDCRYIPHGVDLDIFRPPADRREAKRAVDADGRFLVLSDSRNQPRKMIPRLLDVVAWFVREHGDILLHLHTDPDDHFARTPTYAYDVKEDVRRLALGAHVRFTPDMVMQPRGGVPLETLAAFYRAADAHLLASSGEGFGLPTLQAAAAGAVPLASDYSASRELVAGHGEAIAVAAWTENEFGIRRPLIDVADAAGKLARLRDNPDLLARRSGDSRRFAEGYGWPMIIDAWEDLIGAVSGARNRFVRPAPAVPAERAREVIKAIPGIPEGAQVRVNLVERDFGRLEAAIADDVRGRGSDVRIPVLPRPAALDGLRVQRRIGQVGIGRRSLGLLRDLFAVFPVLSGWSAGADFGEDGSGDMELDSLGDAAPGDLRLRVAQSILLLDLAGELPDDCLADAALLGAPCLGADRGLQARYWPELCVAGEDQAFVLARRLLTDAAFSARMVEDAWTRRRDDGSVDMYLLADDLRRLARLAADGS